jgi:DNA topoisomerase VI subunit A
MWRHLRIPIFGIFDADPFGIEIMLVYRFGSRVMAWWKTFFFISSFLTIK